ncbi:Tn3 family transposase [Arthrobacter sp. ISL-5]|uniref:Tn3 family transposase n=1 Tax=Arthrobacter sp. ISL-5 TaxID=2819111 RepID=UPI001BE92E87|nr:Tn3 family transposase [Arthrobacter sp. ISL-5]MBT2554426.1 Tn3 family transposase [Arthrobacter sp. ISL-5]
MLPFAPIVSLLIELDKRTGYLDCFTHAGGKQARSPELKRILIAVLISHSTNLGLTRMPDATGEPYTLPDATTVAPAMESLDPPEWAGRCDRGTVAGSEYLPSTGALFPSFEVGTCYS